MWQSFYMNTTFNTIFKRTFSTEICNNGISLISACFRGGQKKPGTELGPKLLLSSGVINKFEHLINNRLEFPFENFKDRTDIEACSHASHTIAQAIAKESTQRRFCLTFGGDHSIGTGTVAGLLKTYPDMCLIWIDAHADLNTYDASATKNVHGMPLSFVMDENELNCTSHKPYDWIKTWNLLPKNRLAYIGLRDVDKFEMDFIKKHNIMAYYMNDIDRIGIHKVIETVLQKINPNNSRPIHVSFDVDSLDPIYTPSTGTPVSGGLTIREVQSIAESIHNTNKLVGLDIVEVNPLLGDSNELKTTVLSTKTILDTFILGRNI